MQPNVSHNPAQFRFESTVQGQLCELNYRRDGKVLSIHHVGVPQALEGQGFAGALTVRALDWARMQNLTVVALCPYVAAWIRRNPNYQDLLAECGA